MQSDAVGTTTDDTPVPSEPARDLAPPARDPWPDVVVPDGWEQIAAVARRMADDLDGIADRIVTRIRRRLPAAYGPGGVPPEDLHASVVRTGEMILVGIAEHRGPSDEELAIRRELGIRRAHQGLPVDVVVQAFQFGCRELWLALVAALPSDDPRAAAQLLRAATSVWGWVHEVSDAIAAAHGATVRRLEARAVSARQRFVELLASGDLDGPEAGRLASALGFDLAGSFVATVLRAAGDEHDALEVQRQVELTGDRHLVVSRGPHVVVVSQAHRPDSSPDVAAVLAACRRVVPGATAAVGAERSGLVGARTSLVDAQLTLEVVPEGGDGDFEDAWLWATLHRAESRLRGLLVRGSEVAATHPHLAQAVVAFSQHGFSVSHAARDLGVHANTVGYRLDRWGELTGWDPRSFDGLVRSLAAIRQRR